MFFCFFYFSSSFSPHCTAVLSLCQKSLGHTRTVRTTHTAAILAAFYNTHWHTRESNAKPLPHEYCTILVFVHVEMSLRIYFGIVQADFRPLQSCKRLEKRTRTHDGIGTRRCYCRLARSFFFPIFPPTNHTFTYIGSTQENISAAYNHVEIKR